MQVMPIQYPLTGEGHARQLIEIKEGQTHCRIGTVFLSKGTRLPQAGLKANPEHEISLVLEGKIRAITNDGEQVIGSGQIVHFAPGEMQAGEVLEDCKIIWVLIDKAND